jgi:hypothetical protein
VRTSLTVSINVSVAETGSVSTVQFGDAPNRVPGGDNPEAFCDGHYESTCNAHRHLPWLGSHQLNSAGKPCVDERLYALKFMHISIIVGLEVKIGVGETPQKAEGWRLRLLRIPRNRH